MKNVFALVFIVIAVSFAPAYAIDVSQRWDKTFSMRDLTISFSIQQTSDGGYITAGTYGIFDGFLVIKLDYNGNVMWNAIYPLEHGGTAQSIEQTPDGGYIVAGWTGAGFVVLKLDGSGNIVWQSSTLPKWVTNVSLTQTLDGGFIMTGYPYMSNDLLVLKLDSNGNISWQRTYTPTMPPVSDAAPPIRYTSDGGYIIVSTSANEDILVLKLDSIGNISWQKTYGGIESDGGMSIEETSDGGFIVAGFTLSFGAGRFDVWVLKLNSSGDVIWQQTYGDEGVQSPSSIKKTSDGGYIVIGSWNGSLWVLKLNGSGDIAWQKVYLEETAGYAPAVATTSDGGYIISSASKNTPSNEWKIWILKLDSNGEIPDCAVLSPTYVMPVDTLISGKESYVSSSPAELVAVNWDILAQNILSDISTICQYDDPTDSDGDGIEFNPGGMMAGNIENSSFLAEGDNCSDMPNGPYLGTCTSGMVGNTCIAHAACGANGYCSMNQEDTLPPQGNGIGNACDCEGNFDCSADQGVDGSDAATFKTDFGRTSFSRPCVSGDSCNGDFECDGDVDGSDASLFKSDFGRSSMQNPCPACVVGEWCSYPSP